MKKIINIEQWERGENFAFFQDFLNPCISVTCPVKCKQAKMVSHERKESFFLYYLYAILKAVNEIEEFKYRIDAEGTVVWYDQIDVLTPIKLEGMKGFATVHIPFCQDWNLFYERAKRLIAKANTVSAYEVEKNCKELNVVLVSAVPTLPFTSMTSTQKHKNGNDYPLITVGQLDESFNIPIALSVHHGFVDGEHLAKFFQIVQDVLNARS